LIIICELKASQDNIFLAVSFAFLKRSLKLIDLLPSAKIIITSSIRLSYFNYMIRTSLDNALY
jgi:hypothetical protein